MIYQKDLGDDTEKAATAMTSFDPGPGWEKGPPTVQPATEPSN